MLLTTKLNQSHNITDLIYTHLYCRGLPEIEGHSFSFIKNFTAFKKFKYTKKASFKCPLPLLLSHYFQCASGRYWNVTPG